MKRILIMVDVQNGFIRSEETTKIAEKISELSRNKFFDYVIATKFINKKNSPFQTILNWQGLTDTSQTALHNSLKYDKVVTKYNYTCVTDAFLKQLKEINNNKYPEEVYIAGIDTDCCVLTIAGDLFKKSIRPIVIKDHCYSNGGVGSHTAGLTVLSRLIGRNQIKDLVEIINNK